MQDEILTESGIHLDPIRSLDAIRHIKKHLSGRPRDLLLFTLGINNGLRAGDLLRLTVNDVRDTYPGRLIMVRQKHSDHPVPLVLQAESHRVLQHHLRRLQAPPAPTNMYLFASQEGWTPLKTHVLDQMIREWTTSVGLEGRFGAHSLRKTFGFIQRTQYGVGLDVLAPRFGHASPAVTARYLGLDRELETTPALNEI